MKHKRSSFFSGPKIRFLPLVVLCWFVPFSWADPVLPHLLADHMVLQQERPLHIWGKADPGEKIAVTLADKTTSALTDAVAEIVSGISAAGGTTEGTASSVSTARPGAVTCGTSLTALSEDTGSESADFICKTSPATSDNQ